MTRLKEIKTVEKKPISLTLKIRVADIESSEESSKECSDTENLNLLTKRFQKFIKMKGKMKNQQNKRYNKKYDSSSTRFTCFGCGKQRHIKVDCPSQVNKEKAQEKRNNRSIKNKRAYIAWEDNGTSSSSSSQEVVEANLCLMTG